MSKLCPSLLACACALIGSAAVRAEPAVIGLARAYLGPDSTLDGITSIHFTGGLERLDTEHADKGPFRGAIDQNGIADFFITGRQEKQRAATEKNLADAGYPRWEDLLMQSNGNTDPASVFKPRNRQQIEAKGYHIVLNIGDQASDLTGCCAERVFKLPNPFYLIK